MTKSNPIPRGWTALVRDLTTTVLRDFGVEFLEMHAERGWLHVDVDDRHLGHAECHRLDRVVQGYVTPVADDLHVLRILPRAGSRRSAGGDL